MSVWLALDLVLARRLTDRLELEPATEEDLEADLAPDEPGAVVGGADLSAANKPYRLVVQAKLRTTDPWRVSDVDRLLQHGEKRDSAAVRLKDPDARYLLVTSAALSGGARSLRVRSPGVWPGKPLPASIASSLPGDAAGRVAVLSNYEPEWVESRIKEQLTETFRVPFANWQACFEDLRAGAYSRVKRKGTNVWTRDDLAAIIVKHEGYLASSPALDDYVKPTNWEALRRKLRRQHAALIIGQSGTGKTLATDMLYEELSDEIPGLKRKSVRTPEEIRHYSAPGPVMFDIEDPFGRYTFEEAGRDWLDRLPDFLAKAQDNPNWIVVATTRLDVGTATRILDQVEPWTFSLEASDYGERERRLLYGKKIERLRQTSLRQLALASMKRVLEELSTPLETQKFFDALRLVTPEEVDKNPDKVIRDAIRKAHESSIELTISQQIAKRKEWKAAAVLWGLLLDRQSISFEDLAIIEDALYSRDASLETGIAPLATFLVAARNLRQKDNLLSIYHGRDEKGLLKAAASMPVPVRATLNRLVEILATTPLADGRLHVDRAARLLAACKADQNLCFQPTLPAQAAIDSWLARVLAVPGQDLGVQLRLAAAIGSGDSIEAEIARWLLHRPRPRSFGFMMDWGEPQHDKTWKDRVRASPATKPLLERFIREELPFSRDSYGTRLIPAMARLASGLTPAFVDAAYLMVPEGVLRSEDTVYAGALADLEACTHVLYRAIAVNTPSEDEQSKWAVERLAIDNGEYSPGYLEHMGSSEDGYSAREFLEAYAAEYRAQRGWQGLVDHPRRAELVYWWLRTLRRSDEAVPAAELEALYPIVAGSEHEEDFWPIARRNWTASIEDQLVARVMTGADRPDTRINAMACLLMHAPTRFEDIMAALQQADDEARLGDIALEMAVAANIDPAIEDAAARSLATLPPVYRDIARLKSALDKEALSSTDVGASVEIARLPAGSEAFRHFRVLLAKAGGAAVRKDVTWLLDNSDVKQVAIDAIDVAVVAGWRDIAEGALGHRFADVVARALQMLAPPPPGPLPARLLALIANPGRPVRELLVELLDARPCPQHLVPLLTLAADNLSDRDYHDNVDSLPIARQAVRALASYDPIDPADGKRLLEIAIETDDPDLRNAILNLLATRRGALQTMVFELAVTKGKSEARIPAGWALVGAEAQLDDALLARITPDLMLRVASRITACLALICGWRGKHDQVEAIAAALSATPERRVFLVLLAAARLHRDAAQAREVAAHLPQGHKAQRWALGEDIGAFDDSVLNDLGSVQAVAAVLPFLKRASED
ncbi:nSTAND3 domain-containing NTPase [Sphingomonas sp. OTU376]|uniref:nSTAND3 domain-containing NTPase n=1 Tax=Sphingomonas sp. OTU376 TaxID=3043863 RepID=UPI00313CD32D